VQSGQHQESGHDQANRRSRKEPNAAHRNRPTSGLAWKSQAVEALGPPPARDCECTYRKRDANRRDQPSTEWLGHQSGSPVAGRLVAAFTMMAKQNAPRRQGKADIDSGACAVSCPPHQGFALPTESISVEQSLCKPPSRKTKEADCNDGKKHAAEWSFE